MKKMKFFQMSLFLLLLGMTSVNAQVRIGSDDEPHSGSILDLSNVNNLGLLLPRVSLDDVGAWTHNGGLALGGDKAQATGMVVYNTNTAMGTAVYVWDGMAWNPVQPIPVTNVSLDKPSLTFTTYDTQTLTPTITPACAANKTVTWSSSNESVATVSNGVVTPVTNGTATIFATATDGSGKYATCSVTVLSYFVQNGAYFAPSGYQSLAGGGTTMAQITTYGFYVTGDLLVYGQDLHSTKWQDGSNYPAKEACEALGNGWRLPNIAELGNLQANYDSYGLSPNGYWSCTECNGASAWHWYYNSGITYGYNKETTNKIRCVKSF